ncbi:hypothetical protein CTAYLR_001170 [Chrysophaeum taylorii]|uniref:AAA+ ATPase domain-containing protein n=1 Tax=Chrysophaeum taylorii TaxID=2483200 RepID=A0AAD7UPS7_9STRA|nr:hypothetical protein CTAYLR_001170 [Chrysophaeum taylorii]
MATATLFPPDDNNNNNNNNMLEVKTYHVPTPSSSSNSSSTTIKIQNDLDTDDAAALGAFFVFMFCIILLALCVYYSSPLRLWFRQAFVFPCRRLCCEGERRRLWQLHKDAVVRGDALAADNPAARSVELELELELATTQQPQALLTNGDDPLEAQLDTLVGLDPLKDEIRALRRTLVVEQQRRRVLGKKTKTLERAKAPHMVFRGSPGTGKTHAARLISRLLKELGYVHGDIVEVQRADLVAGYVGQTALKTRAVINKAKGGVLFVDEAYALAPGPGRDFGAEAVQELMRDLTSGDPVVVLAGYPEQMERFLRVNPGLSRRFQVRFTFPDYNLHQLAQIFVKIASRNGYALARDASLSDLERILDANFTPALCRKWNGGLPEGLFRRAQDALAKRLNVLTMSADAALTLTLADLLQGATILAATLGDDAPRQPSTRPRRRPPQHDGDDDDDDDDDIYDDDPPPDESAALLPPSAASPNNNDLDSVLAALSSGGLQRTLNLVHSLTPRVHALELAVNRLSSSNQNNGRNNNPWESNTSSSNV